MEKRTTNLTVNDFEDKKFGAGKRYTRFNTDQGWISSFDKPTIEKLKDSEGKCVSVEITTDDEGRDKITKFFGEATGNEAEPGPNPGQTGIPKAQKSVKDSNYEKDPTGLAVEVFCAIITKEPFKTVSPKDAMDQSIALVRVAQKAFE